MKSNWIVDFNIPERKEPKIIPEDKYGLYVDGVLIKKSYSAESLKVDAGWDYNFDLDARAELYVSSKTTFRGLKIEVKELTK